MNASPSQLGLSEFVREQEDLVLRLKSERQWWEQLREWGKPNFGQMGMRLDALRERLARHFSKEETAEHRLVSPPDASLPGSLHPLDPNEMEARHRLLLTRLDGIIARLNGCGAGFDCWGTAGREFETFATDLQTEQESELRRLRDLLNAR